jgi:hypothetical protein
MTKEQVSRAEAFSAKRGMVCLLFSLASLCFTVVTIMAIDKVPLHPAQVLLWAIWLVVPLAWIFGRPGGWRFTAKERAIISDELVRANQQSATRLAMIVLALGLAVQAAGVFGYVAVPVWWPIAVLGAGVAGAGLAFAIAELRTQ